MKNISWIRNYFSKYFILISYFLKKTQLQRQIYCKHIECIKKFVISNQYQMSRNSRYLSLVWLIRLCSSVVINSWWSKLFLKKSIILTFISVLLIFKYKISKIIAVYSWNRKTKIPIPIIKDYLVYISCNSHQTNTSILYIRR